MVQNKCLATLHGDRVFTQKICCKTIYVHPGTTLSELFGGVEIESVRDRTLASAQSFVGRVQRFFDGVGALSIVGEMSPALKKGLESIGADSPTLMIHGLSISLSQPVVVTRALEAPTGRPESEGICKVLDFFAQEFKLKHLFSKPFLEKITHQTEVERLWDRATTVTDFHVAKALQSVLTKSFRTPQHEATYTRMKDIIWRLIFGDQHHYFKSEACKHRLDIWMYQVHRDPDAYPPSVLGYQQTWLAAYAKGEVGLPLLSPKEIAIAREFRKKERLKLKATHHPVVIMYGPTGVGKSKLCERVAQDILGDRFETHFFVHNCGPGKVGYRQLIGGPEVVGDKVEFRDGIVTQWARKGGILVLDEATMVESWALLRSVVEGRCVPANGEVILIQPGSSLFILGNQSEGRKNPGRFELDPFLRAYGIEMMKSKLSPLELEAWILSPCLEHPIFGGDRNFVQSQMLKIYTYIHDDLGISPSVFGTRELQDVASQVGVFLFEHDEKALEETQVKRFVEMAFHRSLSQLIGTSDYLRFSHAFSAKGCDVTTPRAYIDLCCRDHEQKSERHFLGRKLGMILPGGFDDVSILEAVIPEEERLVFDLKVEPYTLFQGVVDKAAKEGLALILVHANRYETQLLEAIGLRSPKVS